MVRKSVSPSYGWLSPDVLPKSLLVFLEVTAFLFFTTGDPIVTSDFFISKYVFTVDSKTKACTLFGWIF